MGRFGRGGGVCAVVPAEVGEVVFALPRWNVGRSTLGD